MPSAAAGGGGAAAAAGGVGGASDEWWWTDMRCSGDLIPHINEGSSLKVGEDGVRGRVKCLLTSHVMPASSAAILQHINGKKFRRAKLKAESLALLASANAPFLVRATSRPGSLFCALTGKLVPGTPEAVERHKEGWAFLKCQTKYYEKTWKLKTEDETNQEEDGEEDGEDETQHAKADEKKEKKMKKKKKEEKRAASDEAMAAPADEENDGGGGGVQHKKKRKKTKQENGDDANGSLGALMTQGMDEGIWVPPDSALDSDVEDDDDIVDVDVEDVRPPTKKAKKTKETADKTGKKKKKTSKKLSKMMS
ncbi:hypothetical protein PPROV_000583700 [Pycnococcus provasolii]|uniref:Surfeit locus protein 2 n=1 Tax=Pycnococcus provasolii TaxID=41880 RepID=A0A830HIZ0_9CHLO|nr:hypothetical protein PPROV_000583700 [Pycnococcus provasolii]